MVDVSAKAVTEREAVARGEVTMRAATLDLIAKGTMPKGDVLAVAKLAGIMGAKRTADLIPLCHPLPLTHVDIEVTLEDDGVSLTAEAATNAQTGVEMEALTAVSIAALTVYDMCKALEKGMTITEIRLESKTGGKSGDYQRK